MPFEAEKPIVVPQTIWKRSIILRVQSILIANYQCEIDRTHSSFIAESTHKPYMEAHHIIPMKEQPDFENNLDVYANIACLCPVCHRKIHYGLKSDKVEMVRKLFYKREERLVKSGFDMCEAEFVEVAMH